MEVPSQPAECTAQRPTVCRLSPGIAVAAVEPVGQCLPCSRLPSAFGTWQEWGHVEVPGGGKQAEFRSQWGGNTCGVSVETFGDSPAPWNAPIPEPRHTRSSLCSVFGFYSQPVTQ